MPATWTIAIPAWGERALAHLERHAWPAVRAAIEYARIDPASVTMHGHTDRPNEFRRIIGDAINVTCTAAVLGNDRYQNHRTMSAGHAAAINAAPAGSNVMILCADMVISRECLLAAEMRLDAGARLVAVAAIRTYERMAPKRAGLSSGELLEHAIRTRHHAMWEATWGQGRTELPSILIFDDGTSFVVRGFHLHPLALRKDRELTFKGTVDWDVADNYPVDQIHVVTARDEMAALELSPVSHPFPVGRSMTSVGDVSDWARSRATGRHRWMFRHRIQFAGTGEGLEDRDVVREVMGRLNEQWTDVEPVRAAA